MLRAALYARVSTEMQEKEQTIGSQLAAVMRYAEEQGFHTTTALTYTDEGYSGSHLDRPALDELRDHAREGRFDVVVVLCPDRLARRYAYQVLLIEELKRASVEVYFCERPITDSPDDQLLLQIQGAIAEYERAKIAERSRRGRLHRARMGELSPVNCPTGTGGTRSDTEGTARSGSMRRRPLWFVRCSGGTPKRNGRACTAWFASSTVRRGRRGRGERRGRPVPCSACSIVNGISARPTTTAPRAHASTGRSRGIPSPNAPGRSGSRWPCLYSSDEPIFQLVERRIQENRRFF